MAYGQHAIKLTQWERIIDRNYSQSRPMAGGIVQALRELLS